MPSYTLAINGRKHTVDAQPDMPLLWVLRDLLQLTGTKYGCGVGVCGACIIHEGDSAVRSCQIAAADAEGKSYTTIEGLAGASLHPCQQAWLDEDVAQCGYCQPGMIMNAAALLHKNPNPTMAEIDAEMSGSVCRCGTYDRMRRAIQRAAQLARHA